jgi:hypothetical protein
MFKDLMLKAVKAAGKVLLDYFGQDINTTARHGYVSSGIHD